MLKASIGFNSKEAVELEVVRALREQGYNLNNVNNYGENILHIGAANACFNIVKEILDKTENCNVIDRKNKFGWTPLMQAIRNRDINTVKFLLSKHASTDQSTYLGISVLSLAAAINKDMFKLVYNANPSALAKTSDDDINPLCIAAMKNDRDLFLLLLDLGMDVSKANNYTHIMIRQSTVPEIYKHAKLRLDIDDYWNDTSDNIEVELPMNKGDDYKINLTVLEKNETDNNDNFINNKEQPVIVIDHTCENETSKQNYRKALPRLNLLMDNWEDQEQSSISPILLYNQNGGFPASPNIFNLELNEVLDSATNSQETESNSAKESPQKRDCSNESVKVDMSRVKSPVDSENNDTGHDTTLGYTPEFSPTHPTLVSLDVSDYAVFNEGTPTPPHYKTPPRRVMVNSQQIEMVMLLEEFGLSHYISIFLEQEVDMDLFLTLTDNDLIEIGINCKADRCAILDIVDNCYKNEMYR